MKKLLLTIMMLSFALLVSAQTFETPPESGRAFALSNALGPVEVGEIQPNFGGTIDIDYNPSDPRRWARIDNFGILRFVDLGNPDIVEGTYTFPPLFDGFQASSPAENKYFMRDVEWSPDGRMLAFYIENGAVPDLGQGLWFWQPVQQLATDPSYQLMRPCPGYCELAGLPADYPGWEILDFEWSSDNSAILVTTNAFEYGRRALTIRFAQRTEIPPATVAPTFLLYDYGHWGSNGQQIVVSGRSPEDNIVFGTIDRAGGNPNLTLASDIGLAWVQDAVQLSDESFVMLGSTVDENSPVALYNQDGEQLSNLIGDAPPDSVEWSPNKLDVMVTVGDEVYIVTRTGSVYEISGAIGNSPNITWINGELPENFTIVPPFTFNYDEFSQSTTATPEALEEERVFAVGDILIVTEGVLDIYAEPIATGDVVGSMGAGNELIITDEPLQSGDVTWYRVQTLEYTGWITNTSILDYSE